VHKVEPKSEKVNVNSPKSSMATAHAPSRRMIAVEYNLRYHMAKNRLRLVERQCSDLIKMERAEEDERAALAHIAKTKRKLTAQRVNARLEEAAKMGIEALIAELDATE
jgi:hypothetical protein